MNKRQPRFSFEVRSCAVRMVLDHQSDYLSVGAIRSIASKIGCAPPTLHVPIAPSTFHQHMACRRDPQRMSCSVTMGHAFHDWALKPEMTRVFEENFDVYGVRKVWRQMQREGFHVARCTVERRMRVMGLQGVIRGKRVRTTVSTVSHRVLLITCPTNSKGQFKVSAPNRDPYQALGVSDFTSIATRKGHVPQVGRVAFVIDAYARHIVGWQASQTAHTGFVLMLLSKPCMSECSMGTPASSITVTAGASMSLSHTPNACWMPELNRLSAVLGILRQCFGGNHQRPVQGRSHSPQKIMEIVKPSNGQPCNGFTGSTQKGSLSPSEIFHHRRRREIIIKRRNKLVAA